MNTSHNDPALPAEGTLLDAARAWDRFWFRPADPTTLCFMRVCMGVILIYVVFSYSFDLMAFVNPDRGWLDDQTTSFMRNDMPVKGPPFGWTGDAVDMAKGQYSWSVYFHLHDTTLIWGVHLTFLAVSILFTLGLWTRVTSVLAWIAALSYTQRSLNTVFGMDTMVTIGMTYVMLGPAGATLSLDRWLAVWWARRRDPRAVVPLAPSIGANLVIRLCQVHFCIIYLAAGLSKLLGPAWWNGTALWSCLANYTFAPMEFGPYMWFLRYLCNHRLLWELVMSGQAVFTLVMEIGLPFLIWTRFRWVMVCGAILLHLGIGLTMGLIAFSMMMMVLVSSFIPPETIRLALSQISWPRTQGPVAIPARSTVVEPRSEGVLAVAGKTG